MTKRSHWLAPTAAALIVAVSVAAAPPNGGTISVEAAGAEPTADGARPPLADGVGEALGAHGFTLLPDPGHSAYVAEVSLTREDVGSGTAKVASERATVSPGLFGAAGGGVTLPLGGGKTRSVALQRIRLELSIHRRGSDAVVWHGAAVTIRPAAGAGGEAALAASLGEAVLHGYPAEPRGIVSVP